MVSVSLIISLSVQAKAPPDVRLTTNSFPEHEIHDGSIIAKGKVIIQDAHAGVQIWMDAPQSSEAANRYLLIGKNNPAHQLRVCIQQPAGIPDRYHGNGIIIASVDRVVDFEIVVDGKQQFSPDEYELRVMASDYE